LSHTHESVALCKGLQQQLALPKIAAAAQVIGSHMMEHIMRQALHLSSIQEASLEGKRKWPVQLAWDQCRCFKAWASLQV
jgi:hypothetical protein